jgi:hypothetical protein
MAEMGARMAEKGGRRAEKGGRRAERRVQMVVFRRAIVMLKTGINGSICYYTREKIFPPLVAKTPSERDKHDK